MSGGNRIEERQMNTPEGRSISKQTMTRRRSIILLMVVFIALVTALTAGLILYFRTKEEEPMTRTGAIVDCLPALRRQADKMANSETECRTKGCIWRKQVDEGAPWCFYPNTHGYQLDGPIETITNGFHASVKRTETSSDMSLGDNFPLLDVRISWQTNNRLRITISPKDVARYTVPTEALNIEKSSHQTFNETVFKVQFTESPFGVSVMRKETGVAIFNTSLPGMVLADQFLQISTRVSNENIFGFGEHRHLSFHHDMRWKRWSMFTRDSGPDSDWNLYGHHPVYMNVEDDGKANMVLLKNTNAMEVVLQPSPEPAITYKTIGGVLDFYIFLGDSPQSVVSLYQQAIGLPMFPPYWSLGYHLCRWGYEDIDDMRSVIKRNRDAKIPYDGQWGDFDTFIKAFVFSYDKTKWKDFPALVDDLKANGQHFITIVDPGIGVDGNVTREVQESFPEYDVLQSGEDLAVFVKDAENETLYGEVWPGVTAYPDFTHPESQDWWARWIRFYAKTVGVHVDALWIDMNEPTNFVRGSTKGCHKNRWNYPPYVPDVDGSRTDGALFDKTICMDAKQYWGQHYDVHSLYAHAMAMRTYRALEAVYPGKRPWVMTRSSYAGTGHFATKWQGDNRADWDHMHYSIISLMEFTIFGFPMHQDPASFGQAFVDLVKPALLTRYKFLPYLYTLLYAAHTEGRSVFQPLLFEFPLDRQILDIDRQFMLGPAFLISPVLTKGGRSVTAYFPEGPWYDYLTGQTIHQGTSTLATPLDKFNLHIRAGYVIPWQEPDVTTALSRQKNLGLLIALHPSRLASGHLFWDDGVNEVSQSSPNYNLIKFFMPQAGQLNIIPEVTGLPSPLKFDTVEIYGLSRLPSWFQVNGVKLPDANFSLVSNSMHGPGFVYDVTFDNLMGDLMITSVVGMLLKLIKNTTQSNCVFNGDFAS